ncbi:MAG: CARDB domain-containing protein, partial [Candidatus Bathyarchaeia archaeon]
APTQAKTGDSVTVTAKVKNSGELSGAYTADLYVNGAKVDSKTQTIAGGNATATYTFTLTAGAAGSYAAKVGDKTATFVVTKPLTPPNFVYSDLKVTPTTVVVGGNVTVTATVKNTGEQLGLYVVQLAVDGTQKLDMTGSLAAGGSATIKWSVKATTEGTHTVQLRDLQATFTATKPVTPPPTTPDYTWYIVGGLLGIVVLVAVWYILGRRPKNP